MRHISIIQLSKYKQSESNYNILVKYSLKLYSLKLELGIGFFRFPYGVMVIDS